MPGGEKRTTSRSESKQALVGSSAPLQTSDHLALRTLRRYTEGVLAFDDRRTPVRFVIDRHTARLAIPVEAAVLSARQHVLHLPDESRCILQLLLLVEELQRPSAHEAPDRWTAYHASHTPTSATAWPQARSAPGLGGSSGGAGGTWIVANIEAGKTETQVFSGEELSEPNLLTACEHRLVKALNADRALIAKACSRLRGVDVADPLVVGVDQLGVDVRARFGVLRLEFGSLCGDEQSALRECALLFGLPPSAPPTCPS